MSNIIDYIKWRGDLNFSKSEFNEIDSLILNRFSYLPLDNLINEEEQVDVKSLSKRFSKFKKEKLNILWKEDEELFKIIGKSKRFSDIIAYKYINKIVPEKESQFSAITLFLPDDTIYISFRGTDNTLVGWKENFNMSYKSHIPSQIYAKEYVQKIAEQFPNKKIRIGGHSKGGNLAIYSAVFVDDKIKDRIIKVYNNDGPGFRKEIVNTYQYEKIIDKVVTYIPQDSIFGMLLEHKEKFVIVKSIEKGFMEHDIYSWEVLGTDFVVLKEATKQCKFIDKTITNWLENLDLQTREQVIDIVYEILSATKVVNINEFRTSVMSKANIILSSYKQLDLDNKKMVTATLNELLEIIKNNVLEDIKTRKRLKSGIVKK